MLKFILDEIGTVCLICLYTQDSFELSNACVHNTQKQNTTPTGTASIILWSLRQNKCNKFVLYVNLDSFIVPKSGHIRTHDNVETLLCWNVLQFTNNKQKCFLLWFSQIRRIVSTRNVPFTLNSITTRTKFVKETVFPVLWNGRKRPIVPICWRKNWAVSPNTIYVRSISVMIVSLIHRTTQDWTKRCIHWVYRCQRYSNVTLKSTYRMSREMPVERKYLPKMWNDQNEHQTMVQSMISHRRWIDRKRVAYQWRAYRCFMIITIIPTYPVVRHHFSMTLPSVWMIFPMTIHLTTSPIVRYPTLPKRFKRTHSWCADYALKHTHPENISKNFPPNPASTKHWTPFYQIKWVHF